MGLTTRIIEGVVAGVFTAFALILFLICGLFIRRRRSKRGIGKPSIEYHALDAPPLVLQVVKKKPPLQKPTLQAVTWAVPLTQVQPKLRSLSCPPQANTRRTRDERGGFWHGRSKSGRKQARGRSKTECSSYDCQIQFSIFYNFYHSKLFLKLVCAVNIPSTFGATYGSYVKVELLPSNEKFATKIQFHTNNPVYDETLEFVNLTYDELLNKSLRLKLFTMDRFSRCCLVGKLDVPFAELDINPTKPTIVWRSVSSHDSQGKKVVTSKDNLYKGELYISLRYQVLSNKITVVVMKAVNLPQANKIFANDTYVIVKLLLNLKTVQTKKTSCKRRTSSPRWNEPLVFEIDEKIPISEYSLYFKVKSRNSLSEDPTLGDLEVGYQAEGLGKEHWKDMIVKKNQDRALCHKIV